MTINWNPTYSPVWKWLASHAGAIFAALVADPSVVTAFGVSPSVVTHIVNVAGALTALGVVGAQYAKPTAPPVNAPATIGK